MDYPQSPKKGLANFICAVLDMGKNSVIPSMIAIKIVCKVFMVWIKKKSDAGIALIDIMKFMLF